MTAAEEEKKKTKDGLPLWSTTTNTTTSRTVYNDDTTPQLQQAGREYMQAVKDSGDDYIDRLRSIRMQLAGADKDKARQYSDYARLAHIQNLGKALSDFTGAIGEAAGNKGGRAYVPQRQYNYDDSRANNATIAAIEAEDAANRAAITAEMDIADKEKAITDTLRQQEYELNKSILEDARERSKETERTTESETYRKPTTRVYGGGSRSYGSRSGGGNSEERYYTFNNPYKGNPNFANPKDRQRMGGDLLTEVGNIPMDADMTESLYYSVLPELERAERLLGLEQPKSVTSPSAMMARINKVARYAATRGAGAIKTDADRQTFNNLYSNIRDYLYNME